MNQEFHDWLIAEGLARSSANIYFRAVQEALKRDDPLTIITDTSLGASRRDTYRKALLRYARWAKDSELEQRARDISIPGRGKREKEVVALDTKTEYPALLAAIEEEEEPMRSVLVLLNSGLRISEVLRIERLALEQAITEGKALVGQKGRGGRKRERWFTIATEEEDRSVEELLRRMTPAKQRVYKVLRTRRRTTIEGVKAAVRRALKAASKRAGIRKNVHPHLLRKAVADDLRERGVSMKIIAEALGHESVKTLEKWYQDHQHPEEVARARGRRSE